MTATTRSGPVRSETARLAILTSTAKLFAADGYEELTISGIAADAGVGRQTIYRWWDSKSALVAECLLEGMILPIPMDCPDTGDIHADFAKWLGEIFEGLFVKDDGGLLRSLIAAATSSEDLGRAILGKLTDEDELTQRLRGGIGQAANLYPGAPFQAIGEALIGMIILHALSGAPPAPEDAERMVLAVLGPRTLPAA
jgi:AcrR family transcriptional regulator